MDGIKGLELLKVGQLGKTVTNPTEQVKKGGTSPEEAATQFEGLLVQEMLKSMWRNVPKGELLSGSSEEEMYRDMLNEAVATSISEGKGIGVRDIILKDIEKLEKK